MEYVKDILNLSEVAEYMKIAKVTLYRLIKEDSSFPVVRINKRKFIVKFEHLQTWIDKKTTEKLK